MGLQLDHPTLGSSGNMKPPPTVGWKWAMFELVVRGSQRNYEATRVTVDAAGGGGGLELPGGIPQSVL